MNINFSCVTERAKLIVKLKAFQSTNIHWIAPNDFTWEISNMPFIFKWTGAELLTLKIHKK